MAEKKRKGIFGARRAQLDAQISAATGKPKAKPKKKASK